MRTADQPRWVIKEVTYFDHSTHRFVVGDIEIEGEQIVSIQAPGTSTYACALDARAYVCTPGLVRAQAHPRILGHDSERLLRSGVTTAGTLCATASECIKTASRARPRVITRLLLNPIARARTAQRHPAACALAPELRALERIAATVRGHAGRLALAMHCPSIMSAYELAYAQDLAATLALDLGFVLSEDEPSARAFRDRFYCSETHLLGFMQLLRPDTTVWGRAQLTRSDIEILAACGANVSGWHAASLSERRPRAGVHSVGDGARASDATRLSALVGIAASQVNADRCVDAATAGAAAALGERTCGRIEAGMRADLCLFSSAGRNMVGSGSDAFVQLFERGRPDVVLVAGATARTPAVDERMNSSAAPRHIGERACIPRALCKLGQLPIAIKHRGLGAAK